MSQLAYLEIEEVPSGTNVSRGNERARTEELGENGPEHMHGLESGWVAVRLGADVISSTGAPDQILLTGTGSMGEDKEWVALSWAPSERARGKLTRSGSWAADTRALSRARKEL